MTRKVLITGGSGRLGQYVIQELRAHGYDVLNADQHRAEGVRTIKADLCDLGQVYSIVRQVSAIVHLAAIPSPYGYPPQLVFQNNVVSTFNILQAASDFGIKNVVIASSLSALGLAYNTHPVQLEYLPIDEKHPVIAQDVYGISKIVDEEVAKGFARLNPDASIVSLRLPLLAAPGAIQQKLRDGTPGHINSGELVLWSYLDMRDAATVARQALAYDVPGHEILYVNAPETFMETPTLDLVAEYFPDVRLDREKLAGNLSPIDCSRARDLLDFQPQYDFRTVPVELG